MRLIDADKLISEIEGELEVDIVYEDRFINQGLKIALKDIKNQPTVNTATIIQNGWISVKERLPEAGVYVLVACKVKMIGGGEKHYICNAFHTSKFSYIAKACDDIDCDYNEENDEYYFPEGWWEVIKNWEDYECVAIQDEVTHWMPLPEPPKEVQE